MKIGIDARPLISKYPSGIGNYLIHVLENFNNTDENEFYLYSNQPLEHHREITSKFNVKIVPGKIGTLWVCYQLKRSLEEDGIDVFWGTQHMLPLNVKNIRRIVTVHDLALVINPRWGSVNNAIMQNIFAKKSCKVADKILPISKATAKDILRIVGCEKDKIVPILLGGKDKKDYDITKEEELTYRKQFGIGKSKYFLFIGTIEPRKNIEGIIRGFEYFNSVVQEKYHLILAGGIGWKFRPIEKTIQNSKFADMIHLPGYITEKEKDFLYKNASAVVFPSHYEGFGIPVLEAMAYGVPVITTKISSLPEVGGENAFYADDPNNFKEIGNRMIEVSELTVSQRESLDEKEKKWVKKFSWDKCAKRTVEEILSI